MIYVLYATLALLVGAMVIVLIRLQIGPSNLDRAVALDVLTAIIVGMLVVVMALTGRIDLLPLLVVLTSVGFISSTVIARFSQAESISDRRILSREEAESTPEPEFDDSDAPVHPDADDLTGGILDADDEFETDDLDEVEAGEPR